VDAIRASCSFPGLFEPIQVDGRCLADGGLVAPVPTLAARGLGAQCVMGVSVGFNNWNGEAPANLFQVISRALAAAQKHATEPWTSAADIMLEPEVQHIDWDDFQRADEAIAAGVAAAKAALPKLRQLLHLPANAPPESASQPSQSPDWLRDAAL
jgi:NTE family protein